MSLSYEMSLENYEDFYITVRDELKSNNIFGVVTEVNILDQFLEENMISEEFHKKNLLINLYPHIFLNYSYILKIVFYLC